MPIYDRRNDETEAAWTIFSIFRNSGRQRTYTALKQYLNDNDLGYLSRELQRWRTTFQWDDRLDAYDKDLEFRLLRDLEATERQRSITFHGSARSMLEAVAGWIDRFNQRVSEIVAADPSADPLGIETAIRSGDGIEWLTKAAKLLATVQQLAGEAAPISVNVTDGRIAELVAQVFKSNGAELEAVLSTTRHFAELAGAAGDEVEAKAEVRSVPSGGPEVSND